MWRILFFIVIFYFLSSSTNQLFANEFDYHISDTSGNRYKSEDSLIKTDPVLPNITKANSNFVQFPELDKNFPLPASKKAITYPEFSFDRIRKEFSAPSLLVNDAREEAKAGFKEIDSTGRWIASFANENIQVLPVGIKQEISGVEYQLGFTKAKFTKDFTELTVFVKIILPQTDEEGVPIE